MAGLLDNEWEKYLPSNLPEESFFDQSRKINYLPLNFEKLLSSGAIRVTEPAGKTGDGFSLVSKWNDLSGDSSKAWKDKPDAYSTAIKSLSDNVGHLYDGKYRQILWSARQLGLSPQEVFMQKRREEGGLLGGD